MKNTLNPPPCYAIPRIRTRDRSSLCVARNDEKLSCRADEKLSIHNFDVKVFILKLWKKYIDSFFHFFFIFFFFANKFYEGQINAELPTSRYLVFLRFLIKRLGYCSKCNYISFTCVQRGIEIGFNAYLFEGR